MADGTDHKLLADSITIPGAVGELDRASVADLLVVRSAFVIT